MVFSIVGRHRRNSNEMKVAKPLLRIWTKVIKGMEFSCLTQEISFVIIFKVAESKGNAS